MSRNGVLRQCVQRIVMKHLYPHPVSLQYNAYLPFIFTVWKMTETKWDQRGDPQLRGNYHQKIPKIQAMLNWEIVNAVS